MTGSPFALLVDMEHKAAAARISLGIVESTEGTWNGVACRAGEYRLLLGRSAVRELVPLESLTPVPRAPDWVRGVTNLRGQILPVYDLGRLLGGELTARARAARLLVVEYQDLPAGVLVDEVFGFRNFPAGSRHAPESAPPEWRSCFPDSFRDDEHEWLVLDVLALFTSTPFTQFTRSS